MNAAGRARTHCIPYVWPGEGEVNAWCDGEVSIRIVGDKHDAGLHAPGASTGEAPVEEQAPSSVGDKVPGHPLILMPRSALTSWMSPGGDCASGCRRGDGLRRVDRHHGG